MGKYINTTSRGPLEALGKVQRLIDDEGAAYAPPEWPPAPGMGLICVVDNGLFEAAAWIFDRREFEDFEFPDGRPRTWLELSESRIKEIVD